MLTETTPATHGYGAGAFIKARREALGLSQPGLARAARVTPAMISRLEAGQRRGRPAMLRNLAEALQVRTSDLLERAGYASDADYWRRQEHAADDPDPFDVFCQALTALPLHHTERSAVRVLVERALGRNPSSIRPF